LNGSVDYGLFIKIFVLLYCENEIHIRNSMLVPPFLFFFYNVRISMLHIIRNNKSNDDRIIWLWRCGCTLYCCDIIFRCYMCSFDRSMIEARWNCDAIRLITRQEYF